ncbi:MAG: EamA family transporter [Gaiellaceae bacterium]
MPLEALFLALAAAVIHAIWNLLLAGARDPQATTAVAVPVSALVCAPLALLFWHLDAAAWPFIAASFVLELTYYALLASAYRGAELSVVYPLARGLAPVLVLAGIVAFTSASTSVHQIVGVLLVAGGVLLVRGLRRGRGVGYGVAIACCIAGYTIVDKHGVAHASPLAYLELITAFVGTAYVAGFVAVRGTEPLRAAIGWRAFVSGVAAFAAYGLVLAALKIASAASVAAVRETSVLVAAALAAVVLKERVTRWRLAGAVLVAGGVALLSLA